MILGKGKPKGSVIIYYIYVYYIYYYCGLYPLCFRAKFGFFNYSTAKGDILGYDLRTLQVNIAKIKIYSIKIYEVNGGQSYSSIGDTFSRRQFYNFLVRETPAATSEIKNHLQDKPAVP